MSISRLFIQLFTPRGKALYVLATLVFLSACGDSGVNVNTRFADTQNIEEGSAVYFEDQKVGEVSSVMAQGDGQQVELSIDKEFATAISGNAAIVVNRLKKGAPLEIYSWGSEDEVKLEDGQSVKGLDSMFQLGSWMLGGATDLGTGSLSEYLETFQQYLQSDKFQQDKQLVLGQFDSAQLAAKQTMGQVEVELTQAAKQLTSAEGEAAKVLEKLGDELAPVISQLAGDGAQLLGQLRQLSEALKQPTKPGEQKAGEQFLNSLLTTLEKLNQSIEDGSQQNDTESPTSTEGE